MSKLFRAIVLGSALVAIMAACTLSNSAPAQEKKKKGLAKDEIGTTEVYKAKDGWRFKVMNSAGKSVAIGTVGFSPLAVGRMILRGLSSQQQSPR